MYKVLLVDDEALTREAIGENIPWGELGFELVEACENGRDAMEAIRQKKPDLVLTDICMPYVDGIELARYILQSWQKNLSVYFELVPLSPDELASRVGVGNYELALYTLTPSSLTAQGVLGGLAGTAAEGNLARYQSARFSEAFGRLAAGTSSRGEIDELEGILFEECPFIPLSFPVRTVGLGKTVTGVIVRPFSGGAFGAELDFRGAGKLD